MEQSVKKLKVVDIDFHAIDRSREDNLFFDVIEHRFEDDFLVISRYREYSDGVPRKVDEYIPKESIARITIYQEKNDYLQYIDDLLSPLKKSDEKPKGDIIDCHIVWYDKGTGGIMDKIIRYVESVTFEKRINGYAVINYKEHPEDTVMKLFRVPQGDIIQLTRLVNGEQEGSWYEQER